MIDLMLVLNITTAVVTAASIILKVVAPLTKTKKDDTVLGCIMKILKIISIHTKK